MLLLPSCKSTDKTYSYYLYHGKNVDDITPDIDLTLEFKIHNRFIMEGFLVHNSHTIQQFICRKKIFSRKWYKIVNLQNVYRDTIFLDSTSWISYDKKKCSAGFFYMGDKDGLYVKKSSSSEAENLYVSDRERLWFLIFFDKKIPKSDIDSLLQNRVKIKHNNNLIIR